MRVHGVCEAYDAMDCHYHSICVYIAPAKLRVPELVRGHLYSYLGTLKQERGNVIYLLPVFGILSKDQYVKS